MGYYGLSDFVLRGKTHPERAYAKTSGSFALLGGLQNGKVTPELEQLASPAHFISKDDSPLLLFHGKKVRIIYLNQSQHMDTEYTKANLKSQLIILENSSHGGDRFFTGQHFQTPKYFLDQNLSR